MKLGLSSVLVGVCLLAAGSAVAGGGGQLPTVFSGFDNKDSWFDAKDWLRKIEEPAVRVYDRNDVKVDTQYGCWVRTYFTGMKISGGQLSMTVKPEVFCRNIKASYEAAIISLCATSGCFSDENERSFHLQQKTFTIELPKALDGFTSTGEDEKAIWFAFPERLQDQSFVEKVKQEIAAAYTEADVVVTGDTLNWDTQAMKWIKVVIPSFADELKTNAHGKIVYEFKKQIVAEVTHRMFMGVFAEETYPYHHGWYRAYLGKANEVGKNTPCTLRQIPENVWEVDYR